MKNPKWILGAGWLVFLLYAYPGYLQSDSANQLVDSRVGDFTDWQPTIMTEIWRVLGLVIAGPPGMLVLQSGLVLVGAFQLARRLVPDRAAAIIAACVLALPPAMATTAVITPEALLAGLLLCGAAALLAERLWARIGGVVLIALGCGMHDGAPYAALPIIIGLFAMRRPLARPQRIAIAIAVWLAAVLVARGATWLLVDLETGRNEINLARRDVTGIVQLAPTLSDDELRPLLAGVRLASSSDLQRQARVNRLLANPTSLEEREALFAARRALMRAMPGAYAKYRGRVFLRALGVTGPSSAVYTEFVANRDHAVGLQHLARHSAVQRAMIAAVRGLASTPLMRPYLYFALAVVLLPLAIVRRQRIVAILLASGISYELSLFVSTARAEYRDSHWLVVATLAAIGIAIASWLKARHERIAE